eukprot:scaffold757_cov246-Pinguiococcus_pyrenoidosus.AAC.6
MSFSVMFRSSSCARESMTPTLTPPMLTTPKPVQFRNRFDRDVSCGCHSKTKRRLGTMLMLSGSYSRSAASGRQDCQRLWLRTGFFCF